MEQYNKLFDWRCRNQAFKKMRYCIHYATHLLEQGVDLVTIKEQLGHSCIETTMMYLHIAQVEKRLVHSPFDRLYKPQKGWSPNMKLPISFIFLRPSLNPNTNPLYTPSLPWEHSPCAVQKLLAVMWPSVEVAVKRRLVTTLAETGIAPSARGSTKKDGLFNGKANFSQLPTTILSSLYHLA